jgi:fatty acid desaturase
MLTTEVQTKEQLPQQIREHIQPSALSSFLAIFVTWLGIFLTFYCCTIFKHPVFVAFGALIMGGFQHRLFTIYHEAFHSTLFASRKLNEFFGKWFGAYPALLPYANARKRHLAHHALTGTEQDPERTSHLRSWRSLLPLMCPWPLIILSVLARLGLVKGSLGASKIPGRAEWDSSGNSTLEELSCVILTQMGMLVAFIYLFHWYGLLYHASLVLVNPVLGVLRQWVEHYNWDQMLNKDSRYVVITPNWPERFLFAPMNFNYHASHHLYPRVPFSNLPKVQRLVDAQYPNLIHRTGYLALIVKELPW